MVETSLIVSLSVSSLGGEEQIVQGINCKSEERAEKTEEIEDQGDQAWVHYTVQEHENEGYELRRGAPTIAQQEARCGYWKSLRHETR